jgi:hypothetical protein
MPTDPPPPTQPPDPAVQLPLLDWARGVVEHLAKLVMVALITVVVPAVLFALAAWLWRLLRRRWGRLLLRLGTVGVLRRLVVGAYLRRVRETYGYARNVYLDREEDPLDLTRVFAPLTLRGDDDADRASRWPANVRPC